MVAVFQIALYFVCAFHFSIICCYVFRLKKKQAPKSQPEDFTGKKRKLPQSDSESEEEGTNDEKEVPSDDNESETDEENLLRGLSGKYNC